ncbi:MAG: hypothetical protein ACLRSW_05245 [Christensenellaceae bacterium]
MIAMGLAGGHIFELMDQGPSTTTVYDAGQRKKGADGTISRRTPNLGVAAYHKAKSSYAELTGDIVVEHVDSGYVPSRCPDGRSAVRKNRRRFKRKATGNGQNRDYQPYQSFLRYRGRKIVTTNQYQ